MKCEFDSAYRIFCCLPVGQLDLVILEDAEIVFVATASLPVTVELRRLS